MLRRSTYRAIAAVGLALMASSVTLTGCNRALPTGTDSASVAGPSADPGETPPDEGGWGDGGEQGGTGGEVGGGSSGGSSGGAGGSTGGGAVSNGGGSAPATSGGLCPLPKVTPIPPAKPSETKPADPQAQVEAFAETLARFGYQPATASNAAQNLRMQLLPLTRVTRFVWPSDPSFVQKVYDARKAGFPGRAPSLQEWQNAAMGLASRSASVTWYVARRDLYRSIIQDIYSPAPANELVFYKRLNRTGFVVSYRANGLICDYGYYNEFTWRDFIAVPDALIK